MLSLQTVVYLNIRVEKEGLNSEVLEGDLFGSISSAGVLVPGDYGDYSKVSTKDAKSTPLTSTAIAEEV